MSHRLTYLEEAEQDMLIIAEYMSQFYPSTARNFFSRLEKQLSLIKDMPLMCKAYEEDPFFRRMVVDDDYLLFYCVDEEKELIVVAGVFHGSRGDIQQALRNRKSE